MLPPIGGPALVVDAGGGRLAVADPRAGVAWVGPGASDALERVLGLPLGPRALVAALLDGLAPGDGVAVRRRGGPGPALPTGLRVAVDATTLELRLRRLRPLGGDPDELGRGRPPAGVRVHPLDELVVDEPWLGGGR